MLKYFKTLDKKKKKGIIFKNKYINLHPYDASNEELNHKKQTSVENKVQYVQIC